MHLGVQLFTLRELLDTDLPGTLRQLRDIGYRYVETAGLHGLTAAEYRAELDNAGLKVIACHVGLSEIEDRFDETTTMANRLGADWLVIPWISKEEYGEGWAKFAQRLDRLAARVISAGLKLAYHNHAFEFELEDGVPGFDRLWDAASETVEAEVDVYWADHAGRDPALVLRQLAGRVPLAHFKDGRNDKFTAVGEGTLNWDEIIKAAETAGVEYAIVELDECPRDPVDCVAASFRFLRESGIEP